MVIFVTIGGRFIITELSEDQKKLVHNPFIKKIFIFCDFLWQQEILIVRLY